MNANDYTGVVLSCARQPLAASNPGRAHEEEFSWRRTIQKGYESLCEACERRELEILHLIAAGKANKEIAQALCISINTVNIHVAHIPTKTGASNRTEAAAYAARHHLFEPAAPPASPAPRSTPEK